MDHLTGPAETRLAHRSSNISLDLNLPPLPRTVIEVNKALHKGSGSTGPNEVADIIARDPALASYLLKRVNSAAYGLRRQVSDTYQAVRLMGAREVGNIVVAAGLLAVRSSFKKPEYMELYERIVGHSLVAASVTRELNMAYPGLSAASAWTAALLHSIGRLVFLMEDGDRYVAMCEELKKGTLPAPDVEMNVFGVDSAVLGAMAVNAWDLPEIIEQAVRFQNTPGETEDPETARVARLVSVGKFAATILINSPEQLEIGMAPLPEYPAVLDLAVEVGFDPNDIVSVVSDKQVAIMSYADVFSTEN